MIPSALVLWVADALAATVSGEVRERGTGDRLPGVAVSAGGSDAATGPDGRFSLEIPPGTLVRFVSPGHLPVELVPPELSLSGGPWVVYLERAEGGGEIVVEGRRDSPVVTAQVLDRERVLKTPGTYEDPVRLVQSLPGVAVTPEYSPKAGDISVRASQPGENRFYLDSVEIPYLYHYNDYASVFHTRLLDTLTLYPSNAGAPWGDTVGAVVDTRSVWEQPAAPRGSVNVSLIMTGAEVAAPLGEKWAIRGSGRRSYLDFIEGSSEQYTAFPVFWDYFGRLEHRPSEGVEWGLLAFGGGDHYSRFAGEPDLLDPYEQGINPDFAYARAFHVVALQHRLRRGDLRLDGSLSGTAHDQSGVLPSAHEIQEDRYLSLREDAEITLSEDLQLATGGEARLQGLTLDAAADRAWTELSRETTIIAYGANVDETIRRSTAGLYAEARYSAGPLRVVPGLRADASATPAATSPALTLDPRLNARLDLPTATRLRAGVGRYSAFAPTIYLGALGSPDLPPTRAWEAAAGVDQVVAGRWELGLDGWLREMTDVLALRTDGTLATGGTAEAYGLEFQSRYRLRDRFFTWASLSLMQATRTVDGVEAPADYDQPYAISLVASWDFAPRWNLGLRYRLAAGLPETPIVDGTYDPVGDSYTPVYGATNSETLPPYQKVDAHLERRVDLKNWNLTFYAEGWYVPKSANTMYRAYSYDFDTVEAVHGPAFIPLLGVRGEF